MKFQRCLSYDDVLLAPQYSDIRSRSEVSIGNSLDEVRAFELPVISAPMDTITESTMAIAMGLAGGLGVIHRYNTIEEQANIVFQCREFGIKNIAAAIGITGDYLERSEMLILMGASILCLDVAHGHHEMMKEAIAQIRSRYPYVHIMAGNIATKQAFEDLASWGADSVRIGIGGGSICSTRIQTGHGIPTFQSVLDCASSNASKDVRIIADGGIRNSGDIVKALAAGADFVMLGSILSGTDQTPGPILTSPQGKKYKTYRGMASKEAQFDWRGKHSSNEGISTTVPYRGSVQHLLQDLDNGIRSGFSYSGAWNMDELHAKSQFVFQTTAGQTESGTHILGRK
jgi:IMP dehydrogenase